MVLLPLVLFILFFSHRYLFLLLYFHHVLKTYGDDIHHILPHLQPPCLFFVSLAYCSVISVSGRVIRCQQWFSPFFRVGMYFGSFYCYRAQKIRDDDTHDMLLNSQSTRFIFFISACCFPFFWTRTEIRCHWSFFPFFFVPVCIFAAFFPPSTKNDTRNTLTNCRSFFSVGVLFLLFFGRDGDFLMSRAATEFVMFVPPPHLFLHFFHVGMCFCSFCPHHVKRSFVCCVLFFLCRHDVLPRLWWDWSFLHFVRVENTPTCWCDISRIWFLFSRTLISLHFFFVGVTFCEGQSFAFFDTNNKMGKIVK